MIGNLILNLRVFLKQQFFCIHSYKWIYRKDNGGSFENCTKCDLIK